MSNDSTLKQVKAKQTLRARSIVCAAAALGTLLTVDLHPLGVATSAAASVVMLPLGAATLIGSGVDGARSVVTGDIDGDGDLDAVVASQDDGRVRWFENAAGNATSWTAHQIATRNAASWAVVADVDRDNDLDVVASSWGDDRIA